MVQTNVGRTGSSVGLVPWWDVGSPCSDHLKVMAHNKVRWVPCWDVGIAPVLITPRWWITLRLGEVLAGNLRDCKLHSRVKNVSTLFYTLCSTWSWYSFAAGKSYFQIVLKLIKDLKKCKLCGLHSKTCHLRSLVWTATCLKGHFMKSILYEIPHRFDVYFTPLLWGHLLFTANFRWGI